ncbi:hypothetical protein [Halobacillus sp. A5]|uniref:hypothetical protein n=1 Tax=Halobacillus sp. A5 TaxID=2880263 RepID=UPI0020A6B8AB|nr:hypothetical protein [Halobacillus sp. A5]MCP3025864.1 hypothetical protein [Halobacillus sp. A5]
MRAHWFHGIMYENNQSFYGELFVNKDKFLEPTEAYSHLLNMNVNKYVIAPGHVMLDISFPLSRSPSPEDLSYSYMKKGCTLLLVQFFINSRYQFKLEYKQLIEKLKNLHVDFMIVPRVSSQVLHPDIIRYFAKEKAPFIIVDAESLEQFDEVPWGWIAQAQSYRRIPITYSVRNSRNSEMNNERFWTNLISNYGIIGLSQPICEERLSFQALKDSGIYPYKGTLRPKAYADYNLYEQSSNGLIDEDMNFLYHETVPAVTVMRGKVTQVRQVTAHNLKGLFFKSSIYKHFV